MMKFEIHSHEGAGPVTFGMTRAEVRKAIGGEFKTAKRDPDDEEEQAYDLFKAEECFVYYDKKDRCEAIEFFGGEPIFEGENLLKMGFSDLFKRIKELDREIEFDGFGFKSMKLGLGSYAPNGEEEPERPAEGVIVFRKGYYDE